MAVTGLPGRGQPGTLQPGAGAVVAASQAFSASGSSASTGSVVFKILPLRYSAAGSSSSSGTLFLKVSPLRFAAAGGSLSAGNVAFSKTKPFSVAGASLSSGDVIFNTLSPPYVPSVLGLAHVFDAGGGLTRELPADTRERVGSFRAISQAPGGFISAAAKITQAEYDAHPDVYTWGTTWRIINRDDADRVIWAGRLTDPQPVGGEVQLQAQGWGTLAAKDFAHLLWQTRDLERWTAADSEPHNYDTDKKIAADVNGRRILFRVRRKEVFKRNNAGNPSEWSTGVVFWAPEVDINRIAFTIDKERNTPTYEIQLLKATGPNGALTLVGTYSLGATQPTEIDEPITGNPDLLMIRMRRQSEDEKARAFRCAITNVRVNGLAGQEDNYKVHEVVEDIAARFGGTTIGIDPTTLNAMPIDVEDVSAAALLDELGALVNRPWLIEDDGTQKAWSFRDWDARTWNVTVPQFPVKLIPGERFNKVRVPYRYPGGVKAWTVKTADPNPLPVGAAVVLQVDLDDPLPIQAIAEAFAQNIANETARKNFAGDVQLTTVENPSVPGNPVSAWRVRAGDTARLVNYGNLLVRVVEVEYADEFVTLKFSKKNPLLERILARRKLMLARGRSNPWATLAGFDLERPNVPGSVTMAFREAEVRGGRRKFHAVLDWAAVTEDIEGNGTAIQRYVAQFRPVDAGGTPIPDADGGGIQRVVVDRKKDDDPETVDLPTRALLRNLEHPHSWRWQGRVLAVDVLGEKSHYSAWTPAAKPAAFGPPAPTNLVVDVDQHSIEADWDANDPTETETDDASPSLDRRVAYYRVRKFKDGAQVGKTIRTRATHKRWRIKKPGTATWRVDVVAVDHYGNTSSTVQATNVKSEPPTPATITISFDEIERRKGDRLRMKVGCSSVSYLDDDIHHYTFQIQHSTTSGGFTATGPRRRFNVKAPTDADDPIEVLVHNIRRRHYYRARVAAVDKQGKESAWSSWSSAAQASDTNAPPAPLNVTVGSDFKGVFVDWDDPDDDDDSTSAHPDVSYYEVEVHGNSGFTNLLKRDRHQVMTKRRFRALAEGGTYYARVRSVSSSGTKSGWVTSTGVTTAPVVDRPSIVNDAVGTAELDDSGSLVAQGTFKNSSGATRVELSSGALNILALYQSGYSIAGNLLTLNGLVQISSPSNGGLMRGVTASSDNDEVKLIANEVTHQGSQKGYCGLQIPSSQVTAGDTWGEGVTWGGATRAASVPSSVGFTVVGTDSNVSSVSAADISDRGFHFKVVTNLAAVFTRASREYST